MNKKTDIAVDGMNDLFSRIILRRIRNVKEDLYL